MTRVDDKTLEHALPQGADREDPLMKRADRYLFIGICIAGTWVFGPISIPFLVIAVRLMVRAQREGKLTRPWAVTILGAWCLIDAAINYLFWGTDLLMAHDTNLLRTMWSGYGKLFDGAYYIDYNSTALGGTANLSEKTMEVLAVTLILPMRMAACYGFLKMKRWGLQTMVMTSFMWLCFFSTYMFQLYLGWNFRSGASFFGITGIWLLFTPFLTPFIIIPYLYTVNREQFID